MERLISAKKKLPRHQSLSPEQTLYYSVFENPIQNTQKILANEKRAKTKEIHQTTDEQTEAIYSRVEKDCTLASYSRWWQSLTLYACV